MTDRVHSLTVALEKDIRTDDIEPLVEAIGQLRGVLKVKMHVSNIASHMAEERARQALGKKLWEILYPPKETR